jgi:hypothetical protein
MALRKSPVRTTALLEANRRNARKSTGPRTLRGKARISLNALKHGRHARHLRESLSAAEDWGGEALYDNVRSRIAQGFSAHDPQFRRDVDRLTAWVWCFWAGRERRRTKPESASFQRTNGRSSIPFPIGIRDHIRRIGMVFWMQRRRYWTLARLNRMLGGEELPAGPPAAYEQLQAGLRFRVFRLARPGWRERERYGLDKDGNYSPKRGAE